MGKKTTISIYIDRDVAKEAKEMGLNISKTCENALKMAIKQLKPLYSHEMLKNGSDDVENVIHSGRGGIRTHDHRLRGPVPYPD